MKRLLTPLLIAIVVGFAALGINNVTTSKNRLELKEVQLKSTTSELKELQLKYDHLNVELDKADKTNKQKIEQLEKEKRELDAERERLEREVSAKREAQRIAREQADMASQRALNAATGTGTAYAAGGNKDAWLRASGIPSSEWWAVDYIVSRESGWNPCAYYPGQSNCNASPSTACGLVQQNPCGKIPGHWTDPVAALKWQRQYVKDRYGGYPQAVEYWKANGHY